MSSPRSWTGWVAALLLVSWTAPVLGAQPPGATDTEAAGSGVEIAGPAEVDWGPYAATLRRAVRHAWHPPLEARLGREGAATLHFFIGRGGDLIELETLAHRGPDSMVAAAREAIERASPFPPPELPEGDEDRVGVTWTFYYNMSEKAAARWKRKVERKRAENRDAP